MLRSLVEFLNATVNMWRVGGAVAPDLLHQLWQCDHLQRMPPLENLHMDKWSRLCVCFSFFWIRLLSIMLSFSKESKLQLSIYYEWKHLFFSAVSSSCRYLSTFSLPFLVFHISFCRKLITKCTLWRFKMTDSNVRNESNHDIYFNEAFNGSSINGSNDSIPTCTNFTADTQAVGLGIILSVFILVAIVGNILVILSVVCNKHLQTVTNFFIVNLAMADLLLSTIVLPFSASLEVLGCWVFGRVFCNIWAAVDVLCCTASILSLCIISIDRYIGVKHCLKYPTIMTERKAVAILVLVWVSSVVISVGPLLGWKEPPPVDDRICRITEEPGYALFSSLFSFYLPLLVILIMYFRVYVVARRTTSSLEAGIKRERNKSTEVVLRIHCRSVLEDARPGSAKSSKNHPFRSSLSVRLMKFSREKKAAKTLAIVVGMFILCWLPFFFFLPMGTYRGFSSVSWYLNAQLCVYYSRLQHRHKNIVSNTLNAFKWSNFFTQHLRFYTNPRRWF